MITIILNGKNAAINTVRTAIATFREEVKNVHVRSTYEYGDVERFTLEAIQANVKILIIGGGDGSINEMVNALAKVPRKERPKLAILPLGTANDFAKSCGIPLESLEALRFAISNKSISIDIARANERHFVNIATAGFGAQVTAETPIELKNLLGGGAYALMGLLRVIDFLPFKGKIKTENFEMQQSGIIGAVCNGRQAGGGQILAPRAILNDGLLDVMIIKELPLANITQLIYEIQNPSIYSEYIHYFQTPWLETYSDDIRPINLDGEPFSSQSIRFEIVPNAIDVILPKECPCIK